MIRRLCCLFAGLWLACIAPPSMAQVQVQRSFPAEALRGTLVVETPPDVLLNGEPARLAPGARIRGQNNMLAMSGALAGQRLLVHYTIDIHGHVKDVWILTAEEASKRPWPSTPQEAARWTFDSVAQIWTRP